MPEIEAAAVVSLDGLSIASALPQDMSEDRVSAMSAAILSLAESISKEMGAAFWNRFLPKALADT